MQLLQFCKQCNVGVFSDETQYQIWYSQHMTEQEDGVPLKTQENDGTFWTLLLSAYYFKYWKVL